MVLHFKSDGLALAYDDVNSGAEDTILLVHGFTSNRTENWRRLGWYGTLERKGMRILALDCRGHGESDKPHDPSSYDRAKMVGDLFALLDHAGVARVDALGFSMGARLLLAAALSDQSRFKTLILGGIGGRTLGLEGDEQAARGTGGARPSIAEALLAEDVASVSDPIARSFRIFADEQGEDRVALAACSRAQQGSPATREALSQIEIPTLVIAGARDDLAGSPAVLAAEIPGARSVVIPGCDHFSAIPHALFKAAVIDFLDGWLD